MNSNVVSNPNSRSIRIQHDGPHPIQARPLDAKITLGAVLDNADEVFLWATYGGAERVRLKQLARRCSEHHWHRFSGVGPEWRGTDLRYVVVFGEGNRS
jgi:hypothetical protein